MSPRITRRPPAPKPEEAAKPMQLETFHSLTDAEHLELEAQYARIRELRHATRRATTIRTARSESVGTFKLPKKPHA